MLCKNLVNESLSSNEEVRPETLKGAHLHPVRPQSGWPAAPPS